MGAPDTAALRQFQAFIAQTGHTYVFNDETSVHGVGVLLEVFKGMGVNPMSTADLRRGMTELFNIEIINCPDMGNHRYIFTPNHVSDLDALVLGLLHPRMRIVAKNGWTDNEKLRRFLDVHYDLHGLDRTSLASLRGLIAEAVQYFNADADNKHYLIFSQGTISDFNNNSPERISTMAQKIARRTGVPIVNVFVEQVSMTQPTRIVFDEPMLLAPHDDFRHIWLDRQLAMQQALNPPARRPSLTQKHANNNKPGDPFF